jgi:hypothetical protein
MVIAAFGVYYIGPTAWLSATSGCASPQLTSSKSIWSSTSVTTLSSTGQNDFGAGNFLEGSIYARDLLRELNRNNVNSIEDAHSILSQQGISLAPFGSPLDCKMQYPSPIIKKANVFEKNIPNKKRYVLIMSQKPNGFREKTVSQRTNERLINGMKTIYGIPDEQILLFDEIKRPTDTYNALNALWNRLQEREGGKFVGNGTLILPEPENVEILIYIQAHGAASGSSSDALGGEAAGQLATGETEAKLQPKLSQMYLGSKKTKILLIVDACQSAAFIA